MKREPSIHITRSSLITIIDNYFGSTNDDESSDLVNYIMKSAYRLRLSKRSILESNKKIKTKAETIKYTDEQLAILFNKRLILIRQQRKHRAITRSKPGDMNWGQILKASTYAYEFVKSFELELVKGFDEYINVSLDLMENKFRFNFWQTRHEQIADMFELNQMVKDDPNKNMTEAIHEAFIHKMEEMSGWGHSYRGSIKYKYFIMAAEVAVKVGLSAEAYVTAQFETMGGFIPIPAQLVTANAKERLVRWMAEKNIKLNKTDYKKIDWEGFEATTDDEDNY